MKTKSEKVKELWKNPEYRKRIISDHLGKKRSEATKERMRKSAHRGNDHHKWKGDEVGYVGLHKWVERELGVPKECWRCGENSEKRTYDWANKSGKYKRDWDDWIRMCRSCHRMHDKKLQGIIGKNLKSNFNKRHI